MVDQGLLAAHALRRPARPDLAPLRRRRRGQRRRPTTRCSPRSSACGWPTCRSCRCSTASKLVGVIDESDLLLQRARRRRRASATPVAQRDDRRACRRCRPSASLGRTARPCSTAAWWRSSPTRDGFHGLITRFDLLNHLRRTLTMSHDHDKTRTKPRLRHPRDPRRPVARPDAPARSCRRSTPPRPTCSRARACTRGCDYGRSHNPTRWAFERCVADLEGGAQALRVRLRPGRDLDRARAARRRLARRRERRPVRRHLPPVRARAHAQRRASLQLRRPDRPRQRCEAAMQPDTQAWSGSRRRPTRC